MNSYIKTPSIKTLAVIVVILSLIYFGMIKIAGSNILADSSTVTKEVRDIESAYDIVGYNVGLPEYILDDSSIEVNKSLGMVHAYNDNGEAVSVSKSLSNDNYDYFDYIEAQDDADVVSTHEFEGTIGDYDNILVRKVKYDGSEMTLVSYDDSKTEFGLLLLGHKDDTDIESILRDIR